MDHIESYHEYSSIWYGNACVRGVNLDKVLLRHPLMYTFNWQYYSNLLNIN